MMRFGRYLRLAGLAAACLFVCWLATVVIIGGSNSSIRITSLAKVENNTAVDVTVVLKDTRQRTSTTFKSSSTLQLKQRLQPTFDDARDGFAEVNIQQMKIIDDSSSITDSAAAAAAVAVAPFGDDDDNDEDDTFEERRRFRGIKLTFLRFHQAVIANQLLGAGMPKQVKATTAKPVFKPPPARISWDQYKNNPVLIAQAQLETVANNDDTATIVNRTGTGAVEGSSSSSTSTSTIPEVVMQTVAGGRLYMTLLDKESLGESLFQYAALYALSKATNRTASVNEQTAGGLFDIFGNLSLTSFKQEPPAGATIVTDSAPGRYDDSVPRKLVSADVEVVLCCRLLSFKYFWSHESELRQEFIFNSALATLAQGANENFMQRLMGARRYAGLQGDRPPFLPLPATSYTLVSVIIDFQLQFNTGDDNSGAAVQSGPDIALKLLNYVRKAMRYYRKHYTNVVFFVAGNRDVCFHLADIVPNTRQDVLYLPCANVEEVFAVMSTCCHHSIVTAGFLSWWSGWLTGGHVTAYGGWPANWAAGGVTKNYALDDLYPPSWTVIN